MILSQHWNVLTWPNTTIIISIYYVDGLHDIFTFMIFVTLHVTITTLGEYSYIGTKFMYAIEIELVFFFFLKDFLFYLFIYLFICLLFLSVLGLWFVRGLSPVAASGGHSSSRCGDRSSSRCAGISLSRPLPLRGTGSRRAGSAIVAHGPSCSVACGIFPDQGSNPCPLH